MHEESVTTERDGRHFIEYGEGKHRTGRIPGTPANGYSSAAEAENAARLRSSRFTEPDPLVAGPQLPAFRGKKLMLDDVEYGMKPPSPLDVDGEWEKMMQDRLQKHPRQENLLLKIGNMLGLLDRNATTPETSHGFMKTGAFEKARQRQGRK